MFFQTMCAAQHPGISSYCSFFFVELMALRVNAWLFWFKPISFFLWSFFSPPFFPSGDGSERYYVKGPWVLFLNLEIVALWFPCRKADFVQLPAQEKSLMDFQANKIGQSCMWNNFSSLNDINENNIPWSCYKSSTCGHHVWCGFLLLVLGFCFLFSSPFYVVLHLCSIWAWLLNSQFWQVLHTSGLPVKEEDDLSALFSKDSWL